MAARAFRRKLRGDKWRRRRERRRLVRLQSQQRDPLIMQTLLMSVKLQLQVQALRNGAAELDRNAIAQATVGSKRPSQLARVLLSLASEDTKQKNRKEETRQQERAAPACYFFLRALHLKMT